MYLIDAAHSALLVCGIPTLGLALPTAAILWLIRRKPRSFRHFIAYVLFSLIGYFLFFILGIWFAGTFMTEPLTH